jgi:hypothetical protein
VPRTTIDELALGHLGQERELCVLAGIDADLEVALLAWLYANAGQLLRAVAFLEGDAEARRSSGVQSRDGLAPAFIDQRDIVAEGERRRTAERGKVSRKRQPRRKRLTDLELDRQREVGALIRPGGNIKLIGLRT